MKSKVTFLLACCLTSIFFACVLPGEDEHGVQRIRFYLTIKNMRDTVVTISQHPHRIAPRYSTTTYKYDSLFTLDKNQIGIDSIDYEFVTLRGSSKSANEFHLSNTPDIVDEMSFDLTVFYKDSIKRYTVFPWDTTVSSVWVGTWNELGKTYDTLLIQ